MVVFSLVGMVPVNQSTCGGHKRWTTVSRGQKKWVGYVTFDSSGPLFTCCS